MLELGALVLLLMGLGLAVGLAAAVIGLVVHVIMLPFALLGWVLKGIVALGLVALGALAALACALILLPAALLGVLLPLALPILVVWLVWRLARRQRPAGA